VDTDGEQASSPKAPAPITSVIAENVKRLRQEARLSGPALASGLAKHGISWNRSTVAKFETGLRGSITVQELLALALVLDVPPAALLVRPTDSSVPIASDAQPDPWHALLWLLGREPLQGEGHWRNQAGDLVDAAHEALNALREFEDGEKNPIRTSPGMPMERRVQVLADDRERRLRKLSKPLALLAEQGVRVPLPEHVRRHAADLGVDLPGTEA
jgi:transcriptional regulator with XRE-family HTH domain